MGDRVSNQTLSDLVTGGPQPSTQRPEALNALIGGTRAALGQGLMMGWGDEAEAWLRSKLGQGEYQDLVNKIRQEYGTYAEKYPITSAISEFGGGVLPGVAAMFVPGMQPAGATQIGTAGGSALARLAARPIVKNVALGASTGAVSGAGSAVEENRTPGAIAGGAYGAGLGAAIPYVMRAASGADAWLMDKLLPSAAKAERKAAEKMTGAMAESGITTKNIEKRLAQDRALGVPSTVANTDAALTDLAETVAQRTGAGTRKVEKKISQQQAGAKERTYQQVRKGLQPDDFYGEEERLINDLRTKSAPAYEQAYAVGEVDDPQIAEMLKLPQFRNAWATARSIAEADAAAAKVNAMRAKKPFDPDEFKLRDIYNIKYDMKTGAPVDVEVTGQVPDVRTLDYMKRALDAQVKAAYKSDNAATTANANAMKQLRDALRDRTKEVVPEYQNALQVYKGDREILDALRMGYDDFGKLDHEEVMRLAGSMSPAEKEAFRTGVVRKIYGDIFTTSRNINAAGNLNAPEMQAKLQPLFDSPGQYRLFQAAIEREAQLFREANQILRGSQTGKRVAMKERFEDGDEIGAAIAGAVHGNWFSSLLGATTRAMQKRPINDEMANKLAGMLMSSDPKEVAAVVKILDDYANAAPAKAARAARREAGAITGTVISLPPAPFGEQQERSIEAELEKETAPGESDRSAIEAAIEAQDKAKQQK